MTSKAKWPPGSLGTLITNPTMADITTQPDMHANFVNQSVLPSLKLTNDDGRIISPQPLIVNDLFQTVDEHNIINCLTVNLSDLQIKNSDLKILYLNIRSFPSHYMELETIIHVTKNPDFILLTETWLTPTNKDLYGFYLYITQIEQYFH